jgi:MFS family permease
MLIGELAYPAHRGTLTSLWGPSWNMGAIVAAWTTYGTFRIPTNWAWRIPSAIQGVPTIFVLLTVWFIPESPRWLASKGRDEEARAILAKWHCNGDFQDPLLAFEYDEILESIRIENESKLTSSYLSLFKSPGNRNRMRVIIPLAFFSQWSGSGLISYYLTLVLDGIGITAAGNQTLINGILQVWGFAISIIGSILVDRVGRRRLILISIGGMGVCFVCWTICSALYTQSTVAKDLATGLALHPNYSAGHAVLAFIILYNAFYAIGMSPVQNTYDIEICSTQIRAKALTMGSLSINIALIFNQYVNPIALGKLNWKYYIVYDIWLVFEFVYIFAFFLETLGKNGPLPLEETIFLFDEPLRTKAFSRLGRKFVEPKSQVAPELQRSESRGGDDEKGDDVRVESV